MKEDIQAKVESKLIHLQTFQNQKLKEIDAHK